MENGIDWPSDAMSEEAHASGNVELMEADDGNLIMIDSEQESTNAKSRGHISCDDCDKLFDTKKQLKVISNALHSLKFA